MVKAVLFDLDGTLVDTWKLYVHSYLLTFEEFLGRKVNIEELRAWKPVSEIRVLQSVLGEEKFAEAYSTFLQFYADFHYGLFEGVYQGVPTCLNQLSERGIKLGIVTGKSRKAFDITNQEIPFEKWDVVICDDDVSEPKPDPEGILLALKQINVQPEEALYVGDSIVDLYAAKGAGLGFAGVLWPKAIQEKQEFIREITSKGASILLQEPSDLLTSIEIPD
jgi:pyrophosphatase PpaX